MVAASIKAPGVPPTSEPDAGPPIDPGWRWVNVFRSRSPGIIRPVEESFLSMSSRSFIEQTHKLFRVDRRDEMTIEHALRRGDLRAAERTPDAGLGRARIRQDVVFSA